MQRATMLLTMEPCLQQSAVGAFNETLSLTDPDANRSRNCCHPLTLSVGSNCGPQTTISDGLEVLPVECCRHWPMLFLSLLVVAGVTGNSLVCCAVAVERKLRNVTNYFLVSLAIADLLVSLVVMPACIAQDFIGYWPFGLVLCNAWQFADVTLCTSSIMHMCTISLDRYAALRCPLSPRRRRSKSTVSIRIAVVWLVSLAIASPLIVVGVRRPGDLLASSLPPDSPTVSSSFEESEMRADELVSSAESVGLQCAIFNEHYLIYGSLAAFFGPLTVMLVTYALTIRLLRRRAMQVERKMREGTMRRTTSQRRRNDANHRRGLVAQRQGSSNHLNSVASTSNSGGSGSNALASLVNAEANARLQASSAVRWRYTDDASTVRLGSATALHQSGGSVECGGVLAREANASSNVLDGLLIPRHSCVQKSFSFANQHTTNDVIGGSEAKVVKDDAQAGSVKTDVNGVCSVKPKGIKRQRPISTNSSSSSSIYPIPTDGEKIAAADRKCQVSFFHDDNSSGDDVDSSLVVGHRKQKNPRKSDTVGGTVGGLRWLAIRRSLTQTGSINLPSSTELLPIGACSSTTDDATSTTTFNEINRTMSEADESDSDGTPTEYGTASLSRRPLTAFQSKMVPKYQSVVRLATALAAGAPVSMRHQVVSELMSASAQASPADAAVSSSPPSPSAVSRVRFLFSRRLGIGGTGSLLSSISSTGLISGPAASSSSTATMTGVRTERKAIKVVGTMFGLFVACWASFFVVNLATGICRTCHFDERVFKSFLWLGYASSTVNPIIYTIFNRSFKQTFIRLLTCSDVSCCCCNGSSDKRKSTSS